MDGVKSSMVALVALIAGVWVLSGGADKFLGDFAGMQAVSLMGQAETSRAEGATPDDLVAFHSGQWGTVGHVAVAAGATHFWVEDVLAGYDPTLPVDGFLLGDPIHPNTSCDVQGFDGATPVQTVFATQSGRDALLSRQPMSQLTMAVDDLITSYRRSGYRNTMIGPGRRIEVVDVIVPAGDPVHLALLASKDGLIWAFHLEDGAQIAGVTIIGGNEGGVLNLPPDVPVEAMSAATLDDCDLDVMLQDYFEVDDNGRVHGLIDPSVGVVRPRDIPTTIPELEAAVAAAGPSTFRLWKTSFELWFSRQFGQNPRLGLAGYADVQVVIAGQRPDAPVLWTPARGSTLRLVNGPIYLLGTTQDRVSAWDNLVVQFAEVEIGAPLQSIHPNQQAEQGADG